jgi:hypothetical protein
MADLLPDQTQTAINEKNPTFRKGLTSERESSSSINKDQPGHSSDGEKVFSVTDHHPDILFCKIFLDFRTRQGVTVSNLRREQFHLGSNPGWYNDTGIF